MDQVLANVNVCTAENGSRWNIKISTQLVLLEKIIWGTSSSLPQMKMFTYFGHSLKKLQKMTECILIPKRKRTKGRDQCKKWLHSCQGECLSVLCSVSFCIIFEYQLFLNQIMTSASTLWLIWSHICRTATRSTPQVQSDFHPAYY